MPRRSAFTIIELLVVMAIIALMISILLPSLAAARDQARYIKWAGYSHNLRGDPDLFGYYNCEQQGDSYDEVWNRAAGNPFTMAREAREPEDFNGAFGDKIDPNTFPEWDRGRWKSKGALRFESPPDDFVEIDHDVIPYTGAVTIFAWYNIGVLDGTLFDASTVKIPPGGVNSNYFFLGYSAGDLWWWYEDNIDHDSQITYDGAAKAGWHLVVATGYYDALTNREARVYLDGRDVTNHVSTYVGKMTKKWTELNPVYLGATHGVANPSGPLNGRIDELGVLNRALTPVEISQMYKVGKPRLGANDDE